MIISRVITVTQVKKIVFYRAKYVCTQRQNLETYTINLVRDIYLVIQQLLASRVSMLGAG